MGNYPHSAQDYDNVEEHTVGTIIDPWVTAYNYEAKGGQLLHSEYRKNFKVAKIYADSGRMYGFSKEGTKIWLSDEQGKPYQDSVSRVKGVKGYNVKMLKHKY